MAATKVGAWQPERLRPTRVVSRLQVEHRQRLECGSALSLCRFCFSLFLTPQPRKSTAAEQSTTALQTLARPPELPAFRAFWTCRLPANLAISPRPSCHRRPASIAIVSAVPRRLSSREPGGPFCRAMAHFDSREEVRTCRTPPP